MAEMITDEMRRHSAAHMMARAVMNVFPDVQVDIGPATDDGFYYDFDLPHRIAPVIGFARRRSNIPRNNLASFCGALKDVDCSELEATQAAFSEIDAEMWK